MRQDKDKLTSGYWVALAIVLVVLFASLFVIGYAGYFVYAFWQAGTVTK
jgi:hypothetical protein